MKRIRTNAALGGLALLLALAAVGCGGSGSGSGGQGNGTSPGTYRKDANINVRLSGDYDTLNPFLAFNYSGYQMALMSYDRLIALDPSTGREQPWIASSWSTTPDSALLHIRRDVKCQNGATLTPTDVKASLDYLGDPRSGATSTSLVLGNNGFHVTADDAAGTVLVKLGKPYAFLLHELSNVSVICPPGLKNPALLKTKTFGTGPYVLTRSLRGDEYVFTRRDGYTWGPNGTTTADPGVAKTITFKVINSETTTANLLISGGLNAALTTGRDVDRLLRTPGLRHQGVDVPGGPDALMLNQAAGHPGSDPMVRRALSLAVDAQAFNVASSFGHAAVTRTLYLPGMLCYDPADAAAGLGYDVAEAKRVLREDRWIPGSDGMVRKHGKPLVVNLLGLTVLNSGGDYLQTAFNAIGVTTKLQTLDANTWTGIVFGNGNWDATVYVFAGGERIPEFVASQASGPPPPNGVNVASVHNATFDALSARATTAPSNDVACPLWQQGERALLSDADAKPLNTLHYDAFSKGTQFVVIDGSAFRPLSLRAVQ